MTRCCPVCRQEAIETRWGHIVAHLDSLGRDLCPMTGQPYEFSVISNPVRER